MYNVDVSSHFRKTEGNFRTDLLQFIHFFRSIYIKKKLDQLQQNTKLESQLWDKWAFSHRVLFPFLYVQ